MIKVKILITLWRRETEYIHILKDYYDYNLLESRFEKFQMLNNDTTTLLMIRASLWFKWQSGCSKAGLRRNLLAFNYKFELQWTTQMKIKETTGELQKLLYTNQTWLNLENLSSWDLCICVKLCPNQLLSTLANPSFLHKQS